MRTNEGSASAAAAASSSSSARAGERREGKTRRARHAAEIQTLEVAMEEKQETLDFLAPPN